MFVRLGNNRFLLLLSVDVDDYAKGYAIENVIEQIKMDIQEKYPNAQYIYIDVKDSERNSLA